MSTALCCETATTLNGRPVRTPEDVKVLLTNEMIETIIAKIAYQLQVEHNLENSECRGWAGLGLATAINDYDDCKLPGTEKAFIDRLRGYLRTKGYFIAIDLMRQDNIIKRTRNKKSYGGPPPVISMDDPKNRAHTNYIHQTDDQGAGNPQVLIGNRELVDFVSNGLRGREKVLFDLLFITGETLTGVAQHLRISNALAFHIRTGILEQVRRSLGGDRGIFTRYTPARPMVAALAA